MNEVICPGIYTWPSSLISAGFLCGSCPSGTWVTLDILFCSGNCDVGIGLLFLWCKLDIYWTPTAAVAVAAYMYLAVRSHMGCSCVCLCMCISTGAAVIGVSLFVLILDIGHPSELRAFVFYAEVCVCMNLYMPSCLHIHMCMPPAFLTACVCVHVCICVELPVFPLSYVVPHT